MKTTINAQIVAHSVNEQGDELISVLATFPRIILAEVNTHRMLSKNTSSSRAIPFHKMVETIQNDPFIPIAWQKEHKGMQGSEYFTDSVDLAAMEANWLLARDRAVSSAWWLNEGKLTKQLCNRLLEPFMWTTMLITGPKSGWDNFFNLRCPQYQTPVSQTIEPQRSWKDLMDNHSNEDNLIMMEKMSVIEKLQLNKGQAEIHMMALAECIWDSVNESVPKQLRAGEWHIPMKDKIEVNKLAQAISPNKALIHSNTNITELQIKCSVAMAARTSYTVVGEEKEVNYENLIALHDRLLTQDPPHSSPFEHCARAMNTEEYNSFIKGVFQVTHSEPEYEDLGEFSNSAKGWCNNFKGFIPYRYMVDNGNQTSKD
jgi:thymidylate synthase ThyX